MENFELYENMEQVKDSMQFESGTNIAKYENDNFVAEIAVVGDVRVFFNDELYKSPYSFPQELQDIIAEGNLFNDERVEVVENNWFELSVTEGNAVLFAETVDVEGLNAESIKHLCEDLVNQFIQERETSEPTISEPEM